MSSDLCCRFHDTAPLSVPPGFHFSTKPFLKFSHYQSLLSLYFPTTCYGLTFHPLRGLLGVMTEQKVDSSYNAKKRNRARIITKTFQEFHRRLFFYLFARMITTLIITGNEIRKRSHRAYHHRPCVPPPPPQPLQK